MRTLYISLFACLLLSTTPLTGQNNYALVEHFTNTHCPICTGRNPQLLTVLENNTNTHHISYHPRYPYSACIFYQANQDGNMARADYYNIFGTPSSFVGGIPGNQGGNLLSETKVQDEINRPMLFEMQVVEGETMEGDKSVEVRIKSLADYGSGNIRLFVALVEKEIEYNSPNGESVHHDVFRMMLSGNEGEAITLPATGEEITLMYDTPYMSGWQQDEMYAVVFLQDIDSKDILGSASKFDNVTTAIQSRIEEIPMKIRTNPVDNELMIVLGESLSTDAQLSIYNMMGQQVLSQSLSKGKRMHNLDVQTYSQGTYIIQVDEKAGHKLHRGRFVKR